MRCLAGVAAVLAVGGPAAVPDQARSAEPPDHVSVYSAGRTVSALTPGYCVGLAQAGNCRVFSYSLVLPIRILPVQTGTVVVVRTRLPARALSVWLLDPGGHPVNRQPAQRLSRAGTVWRQRLGPGAARARLMRLAFDHGPGFSGRRAGSPVEYYWPTCGAGSSCSQSLARRLLGNALSRPPVAAG